MKLRLIIAYLGNIVDIVSTLFLINKGGFTEANPFMNFLLSYPWLFIIVKVLIMTAVVLRIWICREDRDAIIASWVAAVIYGLLAIYYAIILILIN
jgi:hypothetical protein